VLFPSGEVYVGAPRRSRSGSFLRASVSDANNDPWILTRALELVFSGRVRGYSDSTFDSTHTLDPLYDFTLGFALRATSCGRAPDDGMTVTASGTRGIDSHRRTSKGIAISVSGGPRARPNSARTRLASRASPTARRRCSPPTRDERKAWNSRLAPIELA
jgi:hypothetical protein